MQAIVETLFDTVYLFSVITIGILMIRKSKGNRQFTMFGIIAVILGSGDAFHLIPRATALCTTGLENFTVQLGVGKWITSITMTIFYVVLYHIWRERYQINFELGITALAPDIKIIAPWRMTDLWTMQSREDEIDYCKAHGIDLPFDAKHSYSRDRNLWHISHEGLELEDPSNEPNYDDLLVMSTTPEKAPDKAEYVTMTFEKGIPKSINGEEMKVSDIIRKLNELGGKHGIGIIDIVENRVVGMKSRGVYETPGGTILYAAHQQLEELILDRATAEVKKEMSDKLAQLVYEGKWFTPLREAIQAFVESTQEYVTGEVKFKLYKGTITKAGTTSPYSLYSESLASFTTGDLYDHHDASGFINLFGLPLKVRAMKLQNVNKNQK